MDQRDDAKPGTSRREATRPAGVVVHAREAGRVGRGVIRKPQVATQADVGGGGKQASGTLTPTHTAGLLLN
ncbi:hypothetical protein MRX96_007391 [Rhipicephalus microplus]